MAIVTIRIGRGVRSQTKQELAASVTETIARALEISSADITVLFEEYGPDNWIAGGGRLGERAEPSLPDLDTIFRKPVEKKTAPPAKPAKAPARKAPAKSRSRR